MRILGNFKRLSTEIRSKNRHRHKDTPRALDIRRQIMRNHASITASTLKPAVKFFALVLQSSTALFHYKQVICGLLFLGDETQAPTLQNKRSVKDI